MRLVSNLQVLWEGKLHLDDIKWNKHNHQEVKLTGISYNKNELLDGLIYFISLLERIDNK